VSQRKGVVLVLVLILAAIGVSLAALLVLAALAFGTRPAVESGSTLVVRLGAGLDEVEPRSLAGQFLPSPPTVRGVVDSLHRAKSDPRITAVIVEPRVAQPL
jgi:hypothetical protein